MSRNIWNRDQKIAFGTLIVAVIALIPAFLNSEIILSLFSNKISDPSENPSQISITEGWIRAGAIDSSSGIAQPGQTMIEKRVPVTISPQIVPEKGDIVTIINNVNLRDAPPLPPKYNLQREIDVLKVGEKVKVIEINTFVDKATDSTFTRVWIQIQK